MQDGTSNGHCFCYGKKRGAPFCISTGFCVWVCVWVCTGKLDVLKHLCPQKRKFTIFITLPIIMVWKVFSEIVTVVHK